MKNATLILLLFGLMFGNVCPASADVSIGTVDFNAVLRSFWRAQEADAKIKEVNDGYKREMDEKIGKGKALEDVVRSLSEDLRKPEIIAAKKETISREIEKKYAELQAYTKEVQAFGQEKEKSLNEMRMRIRAGIVEEIKKVVDDYARSKGLDLVFDTSGLGVGASRSSSPPSQAMISRRSCWIN